MKNLKIALVVAAFASSSIASASSVNASQEDAQAPYPFECDLSYSGAREIPSRAEALSTEVGGQWKIVPESIVSGAGKALVISDYAGYEFTIQSYDVQPEVLNITVNDKVKDSTSNSMVGWYQETAEGSKKVDLRFAREFEGSIERLQLYCWKK